MQPDIVAIDGGGSSTTVVACDASGCECARTVVGSTSPKAAGRDSAAAELVRGFDCIEQQGVDARCARVVVCGLSGLDTPSSSAMFAALLDACGIPQDRRIVCSDALLPLFATGFRAGSVIVAGTGSVAVHLDEAGIVRRVGGWGYAWSDKGSGCWIGSRALEATLLYRDGACDYDPLFDEVLRAAEVRSFDELAWWAVDGPDAAQVARLAPAVTAGTSAVARSIITSAARELARLFVCLRAHCAACCEDEPLVLSGGLFASDPFCFAVQESIARSITAQGQMPRIAFAREEPVRGGVEIGRLHLAGQLPRFVNPWESAR